MRQTDLLCMVCAVMALLLAIGCAGKARKSDIGMIEVSTYGLSNSEVERAILGSLATTLPSDDLLEDNDELWFLEIRSPGVVTAGYQRNEHYLRVAIRYNNTRIKFVLAGSRNLRESKDHIHIDAIEWIRDLEIGIRRSLGTVALARPKIDKVGPIIVVPERVEVDRTNGKLTLKGAVEDDSPIDSFTIDGREVQLDASGSFTFQRYIPSGKEEQLEVVAIDRHGNRSIEKVVAIRGDKPDLSRFEFEPLDPTLTKGVRRKNPAAALVIGIEDYKRMPEALYASSDARVFKDYAQRTLGVPPRRIVTLLDSDADHFGIQHAVRRLRALVDAKTDLYVYFAGHGFASGEGVPYLLPHDGDARFLDQLRSREDLFASLVELNARSVTVFLDTCYSGRGREGTQLAKGMRPLVVASSNQGVPEGFTVISAASSSEFSGDLPEAEHGLFSYYLMRGLGGEADGNGDRAITVEELHGYVKENVGRQAARLGREQSPELYGERDRVLVRY